MMPFVRRRSAAVTLLLLSCSAGARVVANGTAVSADGADCRSLRPDGDGSAVIWNSGCYVLQSDIQARWRWVVPEGGRKGPAISAMVPCHAHDVHIDLAGHELRTDTGALGVVAKSSDLQEPMPKRLLDAGLTRRLVLRNGRIKIWNSDGNRGAPAVVAADADALLMAGSPQYPMPPSFGKVHYVLEDLDIDCTGGAAQLFGDGIVVRRCRIHVEGENALTIYGPNALIEDNRIVYRFSDANPTLVTATHPKPSGHQPRIRSAVYLRAAQGTVVRGNTIDVDADDAVSYAVSMVDSEGVLVEGNTFNKRKNPVRLHGHSSASLRSNRLDKDGLFTKAEALPDEDLK